MMQLPVAPRRITLVANELRGLQPAGGIGTATAFLALALARAGHATEVLIGWRPDRPLDPFWAETYDRAGIRIRRTERVRERVHPYYFGVMESVERALRADPPDVVIASDFGAPAYNALRLRAAGLGFERSLFVVFCHGTRRYLLDSSRELTAADVEYVVAIGNLEQASVELADVVVSPSMFLLDWMREQEWSLPDRAHVIPYLTPSAATGEPVPRSSASRTPLRHLVFFGRLDEKKGLLIFTEALNALDPELLRRCELVFLGRPTSTWPRERVARLLSQTTAAALRGVVFETDRDQHEALALLGRPGTLAVMPSLWDNSPNTVYECLEREIPFVASDVGGIGELVAGEERGRVLFEPTAAGVEDTLRASLSAEAPLPVRAAFAAGASLRRWQEIVQLAPPPPSPADTVDADDFAVVSADDASADEEVVSTLVHAGRVTAADVVTCATRTPGALHFFSGRPRGLQVLGNDYGHFAVVRRSMLGVVERRRDGARDPDWALLTSLERAGARVVSVPLPLVTRAGRPGSAPDDPAGALAVVETVERALPASVRSLARLVAGLAADRDTAASAEDGAGLSRRAWRRLNRARSVAPG